MPSCGIRRARVGEERAGQVRCGKRPTPRPQSQVRPVSQVYGFKEQQGAPPHSRIMAQADAVCRDSEWAQLCTPCISRNRRKQFECERRERAKICPAASRHCLRGISRKVQVIVRHRSESFAQLRPLATVPSCSRGHVTHRLLQQQRHLFRCELEPLPVRDAFGRYGVLGAAGVDACDPEQFSPRAKLTAVIGR